MLRLHDSNSGWTVPHPGTYPLAMEGHSIAGQHKIDAESGAPCCPQCRVREHQEDWLRRCPVVAVEAELSGTDGAP